MAQDDGFKIASRTQSAETIQKLMEAEGYDQVDIHVFSDQPEPDPAAAEPPAPAAAVQSPESQQAPDAGAQAQPQSSSVPSNDPGPHAGDPQSSETIHTPDSEPGTSNDNKPPTRGYKRKIAQRDEKITRQEQEIADLKRQLAEKSAAPAPKVEAPPAEPQTPPAAQPPKTEPAKPAEPKPAPAKAERKPKPTIEQFADDDDPYLALGEAISRWAVQDEQANIFDAHEAAKAAAPDPKPAETAAPVEIDEARKEIAVNWGKQITGAKEKHADFEAALNKDHGKPVWNPVMQDAAQTFENGAELVYFLATHPDEAHRIQNLTAIQQGDTRGTIQRKFARACFELGRINLESGAAPQQAAPPQAAPQAAPPAPTAPPAAPKKFSPPTPVGTRGAPGYRTLEQMSPKEAAALPLDEYRKRRDAGEGR